MISFAGGLPAPESFPPLDYASIPARAQQYGASEGEPELRAQVVLECAARGLKVDVSQVLILNGSQQGLDLVAKLFLQAGTRIALEDPSYLAALQVFRLFQADCVALTEPAPLAYLIPNFQNPSSRCWTSDERTQFAASADASAQIVFEDDPYRDLCYEQVNLQPVVSYLQRSLWVYQSSFSKSLCPGLRLGFLVASPTLMPYLVRLKQAADLCSNRLSQFLVLEALLHPRRATRLQELQSFYRQRRDLFQATLTQHFGQMAQWTQPSGGMFFWLKLKAAVDTRPLLSQAIAQNVAFMPGEYFFLRPEQARGYLRLNFSHSNDQQTQQGLRTLAHIIQAAMPL
jgi:DNA-binding transcriptional MocR family regulator